MRKLFKTTLVFMSMVLAFTATAKTNTDLAAQNYVLKYSVLATYESMRSGIPVSVILAQGILESRSGQSELTLKSNNHFGIKWHDNMVQFDKVYAKDDTYNLKGELVDEPFVKYVSDLDSYKHHTDFLVSQPLYRNLFTFHRDDYKNWCDGLTRCGYATDSNYGENLIKIIERLNLHLFDMPDEINPDQMFGFESNSQSIAVQTSGKIDDNDLHEGFFEYNTGSSEFTATKSVLPTVVKKISPKIEPKKIMRKKEKPEWEGFYEYSSAAQ